MKNLKDQKRGGFYWVEGKPFPSVTKILGDVIRKPALEYWMKKEVYLAMVADPTLSETEAMVAPYAKADKAKSRGTTVHSIIEATKQGAKIEEVPEAFAGYKKAFDTWLADIKPEIVENEKTLVNIVKRYAGTCDMIAKIDGKSYVVDFKTSKDGATYQEAELQIAAYFYSLEAVSGACVVGLGENGTYTHKVIGDLPGCFGAFLATKTLWEFLNREDCKKVGYEA